MSWSGLLIGPSIILGIWRFLVCPWETTTYRALPPWVYMKSGYSAICRRRRHSPKRFSGSRAQWIREKLSLLRHNRYFCQGSPTLVLTVPLFIFDLWDIRDLSLPSNLDYSSDLPAEDEEAFILLDAGRLATLPWESHPLRSIGDYFFISQILLKGPVPAHLRGQTHSEGGIFHHPKTPLPKNVALGHGVYLGENTQVGRDSLINRTILYGHQNLGAKVVMENKLVSQE
jgi:hypothetical protein